MELPFTPITITIMAIVDSIILFAYIWLIRGKKKWKVIALIYVKDYLLKHGGEVYLDSL